MQVAGGSRAAAGEARDKPCTDRLDRLVEQRPGVAAPFLEAVEQGDPGRGIAGDQRGDERVDGLGVGQAEQVADTALVDRVGRG